MLDMSENTEFRLEETVTEEKAAEESVIGSSGETLNINYVLERIERIATQTDYLHNTILELGKTTSGGPGDVGAAERAHALGEIVTAREATNQKLISLYEKMYDDLKPEKINTQQTALIGILTEALGDVNMPKTCKDIIAEAVSEILKSTIDGSF